MFDPLHKWLGIPPSEQPPDDYRLLGVARFESDPEVIDAAADRHLTFLHDLTNGEHGDLAESLSNRISATRIRLLHPEKKAAYDNELRAAEDDIDVDSVLDDLHHSPTAGLTAPPPVALPQPPSAQPPPLPELSSDAIENQPPDELPASSSSNQPPVLRKSASGKPRRQRRFPVLWLLSIVPGLIVLSVLIYMIWTHRLTLDQEKLEQLGVPKEQASKLAGNDEPPSIRPQSIRPQSIREAT